MSSREEFEKAFDMVADMDGEKRKRSVCSRQEPSAALKILKDGNNKRDEIPDRVTLKKEIGLLSACTIIIGKVGKNVLYFRDLGGVCSLFYLNAHLIK